MNEWMNELPQSLLFEFMGWAFRHASKNSTASLTDGSDVYT